MPETACLLRHPARWTGYMTEKLREYACKLRKRAQGRRLTERAALPRRTRCCRTIYRMLCICLGEPPKTFDVRMVRDKDNNFYPRLRA